MKILGIKEVGIRVIVVLVVVLGIVSVDILWKLIFFVVSGIVSGLFYGYYNDTIWSLDPDKQLVQKSIYRVQQIWTHLLCGIIGGLALYLLLPRVGFLNFEIESLNWTDLVLFILATLGYTGMLTRTFWFFANRPNIKS